MACSLDLVIWHSLGIGHCVIGHCAAASHSQRRLLEPSADKLARSRQRPLGSCSRGVIMKTQKGLNLGVNVGISSLPDELARRPLRAGPLVLCLPFAKALFLFCIQPRPAPGFVVETAPPRFRRQPGTKAFFLQNLFAERAVRIIPSPLGRMFPGLETFRKLLRGLSGECLRFREALERPTPDKKISTFASSPELREVHDASVRLQCSVDKSYSPSVGAAISPRIMWEIGNQQRTNTEHRVEELKG